MTNSNKKILGLDPGTRETGFAILNHAGLLDYGVKNFTERAIRKNLLADAQKWLIKLIRFHRPKIIIIEKSNLTRLKSSRDLKFLIRKFADIAKKRKVKVIELSPLTVRKILFNDGWTTKKETAKFIAREHFSELQKFLKHNSKKWYQDYWSNMFDAVALALAYRQKHKK